MSDPIKELAGESETRVLRRLKDRLPISRNTLRKFEGGTDPRSTSCRPNRHLRRFVDLHHHFCGRKMSGRVWHNNC